MSLYTWWQNKRFRIAARNRHGVHSPFVYDFVEQVLNGHYQPGALLPEWPGEQLSWYGLVRIMALYYGCSAIEIAGTIITVPVTGPAVSGIRFRKIIVINDIAAGIPEAAVPGPGREDTILVVGNLYGNRINTVSWTDLRMQQGVTLALDLFDAGILWGKQEFLVPQYFRLRY